MADQTKQGVSRRDFLKIGGLAAVALQVAGAAGAGLAAGKDYTSYTGWESFEGATQFVDRNKLEMKGPPYVKVGQTRRPSKQTEYIFGRARWFAKKWHGTEDQPGWRPEDGLDVLEEPYASFYKEHPDALEADIRRETEIFPKNKEDRAKYGDYFALADAWSSGWSDIFPHYPPEPTAPPEISDFEGIRPEPLPFKSPEHAAALIKKVAYHFGATLVGITKLNPDWAYDVNVRGGEPGPFEVPKHWEYVIAVGVPQEWEQVMSNPAHGTSYDGYARARIAAGRMAAFVKNLGYPARAHVPPGSYDLIMPPILVDAGIGQQGRHGFVINPETGANFRCAVVTTNLPMAVDKPIDFGVAEFCNTCKICAEQCPSGSISLADSNEGMTTRGYRHWEINTATCLNFWESTMGPRGCRLCIATCPYSRRNNWVHAMARQASSNDPTGLVDRSMIWMQKSFFEAPGAQAYLPPPDGRFAGYRPAPEWLDVENWFDIKVNNPQIG